MARIPPVDETSAPPASRELVGERRAWLFCHAISTESDCLVCSTFFRRLIIDGTWRGRRS
jgi:hypothetical protein